jgi:hypothetical protein
VGFHVLLSDAAAGAGAGHPTEIDVVLASQLADQRGEGSGGLGGSGRGRGWGRRRRRRRGLGGRHRRCRRNHRHHHGGLFDAGYYGVDAYGLAFFHQDLGDHAGGGRGDLGVHLVGGDFE